MSRTCKCPYIYTHSIRIAGDNIWFFVCIRDRGVAKYGSYRQANFTPYGLQCDFLMRFKCICC